jgi:hypothetical protein
MALSSSFVSISFFNCNGLSFQIALRNRLQEAVMVVVNLMPWVKGVSVVGFAEHQLPKGQMISKILMGNL